MLLLAYVLAVDIHTGF